MSVSCQHCASTELEPFSPLSHAATHGAIVLCRRCQRVSVMAPSSVRRAPAFQSATFLPTAA